MSARTLGPEERAGNAPAVDIVHGIRITDPYRWLEHGDSPEVHAWLDERDREFAMAARGWPMRQPLADDIRELVSADLWSPPVRRGRAVFATRRDRDAEHPRLVVFAGNGERTVFDPAVFDPGGTTTLDAWEPSPDGRYVAVQTSSGGTERGSLRVLATETGLPVEEPIWGVRYSHVAWLPGARGPVFYYVRRDNGDGRRGVWLHRVAAPRRDDVLVHACTAERTVPGVRLRRGRWLLISESHGTGHRNDLWLADLAECRADAPELTTIHSGIEVESEAEVGPDGMLYLRTTHGAPMRRVCRTAPDRCAPEHWEELVAEDPTATLDGFAVAGTAAAVEILVTRTRLGISELTAHSGEGHLLRPIPLPGEGMVTRLESHEPAWARTGEARDHGERVGTAEHGGEITFCYADVATQQIVLTYLPGWPEPRRWPEPQAPPPTDHVRRETLTCRSADGTQVPITVFSLEGAPRSGPTILHAYGGFGRPRQFGFSATVLAWLRAGGRYAVAHVRGGGDGGRRWHVEGARRAKIRSVEDLIAAADELVAMGYCTRASLCLSGGSAGGLLVLAAAMLRPDVCGSVIASAPLTDMARFERLGLGAMWTREFGTVADPGDFAALLRYSPYHHALRHGGSDHPAILLTGFHGDTRTDAAHPRKMCAALREHGSGTRPVLLRYEHGVGHGARAVTRAIDLAADAHAFAAAQTGLLPADRTVGAGVVPSQQEER
ncbi:prolyl oligopeptidase family serine peptidase [Salinactinospora qingdaonensis]|uniref:prolyl oligopeptidase n=1 Tax=Salinactinospora qingdaonensis TaxID=702744 RepID=A0ABP7F5N5_9ACTN